MVNGQSPRGLGGGLDSPQGSPEGVKSRGAALNQSHNGQSLMRCPLKQIPKTLTICQYVNRMRGMEDLTLSHVITSYECGADLLLKPECMLLFAQEMAESHASRNNLGYDWVFAHNMIWVEVQGEFEFLRRPRWKEQVTLRTNTGKASALQARRFV